MGLDQAVLQGFESGGSSGEGTMTKEEVERLLRHGAYDIFNEEKAGSADAESNDFVQQDIDSILARRSKTVVHDQTGSNSNAAGGTFSKASFRAPKTPGGQEKAKDDDIDIDDPDFWTKMVGEPKFNDSETVSSGMKRKRMHKNYSEIEYEKRLDGSLVLSDSESSYTSDSASDDLSLADVEPENPDLDASQDVGGSPKKRRKKKKKEKSLWGGSGPNEWNKKNAEKVLKALQMYGYGNLPWATFMENAAMNTNQMGLDEVCESSIVLCFCLVVAYAIVFGFRLLLIAGEAHVLVDAPVYPPRGSRRRCSKCEETSRARRCKEARIKRSAGSGSTRKWRHPEH